MKVKTPKSKVKDDMKAVRERRKYHLSYCQFVEMSCSMRRRHTEDQETTVKKPQWLGHKVMISTLEEKLPEV